MIVKKNIWFVFVGLILPLMLLACTAQAEFESVEQGNTNMRETAVTVTRTPAAEANTATPSFTSTEEPIVTTEATSLPDEPEDLEIQGTPTSQASAEPTIQPAVQALIDLATEDLAGRLDMAPEEIELLSFEFKEWPDGSLGCPQPGMEYAQVLQEGYLIRLKAGGLVYEYHGGGSTAPFLCLPSAPDVILTKQPPLELKQTPTKSVPPPRD